MHHQALIQLANEGTDPGKAKAAQALAKVAITSNPEIAFPGQRVSNSLFNNVYREKNTDEIQAFATKRNKA